MVLSPKEHNVLMNSHALTLGLPATGLEANDACRLVFVFTLHLAHCS